MDLTNQQRKDIYNTLRKYNVVVLDNEIKSLEKSGETINLYGMWYNPKYYIREDFELTHMEKLLTDAKDGFNILLTHNPDDFEVYAAWGADLTFSGHVHGGMVRLPFIGGLISPNRTLFPKYDAGIYEYNDAIYARRDWQDKTPYEAVTQGTKDVTYATQSEVKTLGNLAKDFYKA